MMITTSRHEDEYHHDSNFGDATTIVAGNMPSYVQQSLLMCDAKTLPVLIAKDAASRKKSQRWHYKKKTVAGEKRSW